MRVLSFLTLLITLPFLSLAEERTPEDFAKEIASGIEKTVKNLGDEKFVLISFINGSVEIISMVKPAKEWDEEYKKSLEAKIVLTIKRGGTIFQLLQIKEKEKVLI